jgi:PAS domain S-box-containing protein
MEVADAKLDQYYQDEYLVRLNPNLDDTEKTPDYWPKSKNTRLLQNLYIASNQNVTGEKHLLEQAEEASSYSQSHKLYHPVIRNYLQRFGYYDIFLVDHQTGHIVYSVFKEVDYATSLLTGPYKHTNFASAFRSAKEAKNKDFVKLVDYAPYYPSYNAPASFITSPIFDGTKKIGVLVFQMPVDKINNIMTSHNSWSNIGLGDSGETYIVGGDYTLRNQSRFLIEDKENYFNAIQQIGIAQPIIDKIKNFNSTIGLQEVKTKGTIAAQEGQTDTEIFPDYRGVPVLSSYKPLAIAGVDWVIMSEIDEAEAFIYIYSLRDKLALWLAGLIIAIVIISFFFSRSLTKPLKKLTRNAEELAQGRLDIKIDLKGNDEIGLLAKSFDLMRQSIKKLIGDLEEINLNLENKVIERTRDLEQAHKRIDLIVENANDAIITIDSDQNIILFNPAAEKAFGYTNTEVLGAPLTMLLPEKHRHDHQQHVNAFAKEDVTSRPMDTRRSIYGQRKNGEAFPVEAGISKIEISGELFFTAFARDITERKQSEEKIRKLSSAVERSTVSIMMADKQGVIDYVNPAFTELSGYSHSDAVGQDSDMLNSDKIDSSTISSMMKAITKGESWSGELLNKKKNGEPYWVHTSISSIRNEQGEISQYFSFDEDITVQKKLQDERDHAFQIIRGSIQYASSIQRSILPPDDDIRALLANHFVLWKPRDVVGGDFYWCRKWGEGTLVILADCTGHGVPGAFMTLIAHGALDKAWKTIEPGDVASMVTNTHQIIQSVLGQDKAYGDSDDGLELGACYISNDHKLIFAGARFSLFYHDKGSDVVEVKGNKKGIGYRHIPQDVSFTNQQVDTPEGRRFILTSDGIIDQVGGEKRRGFGKKHFKQLLLDSESVPLEDLGEHLYHELKVFQKDEIRRDDVSILGFTI